MRAIFSNLGFVMQFAGVLMVIPIVASFVLGETTAALALFITSSAFLILGFFLNSLCERKDLGFKESSALIVLVFIVLGVIGAFPYFYLNIFNGDLWQRITDSFFESISGYTTTGFSLIKDFALVPKSIILYRALTQFIGGIGIVLVLLIFFYPEEKLKNFSRSMGFSSENNRIKKTFIILLLTYCFYTIVLTTLMFFMGYKEIINSLSFIFSSVSTGGFSPINDITSVAKTIPLGWILIAGMVIGASNFLVLAKLIKFKLKEFFISEISVFILFAAVFSYFIKTFFSLPLFDSIFHTVSAMSTTGFSYINLASMPDSLKILFVFMMFIGGASFSTAGGIKFYRLFLIFKALGDSIRTMISGEEKPLVLFGREYSGEDVLAAMVIILLYIVLIAGSAYVFLWSGFSLTDSIFEVTSAISTSGLSVGIANASLAIGLKWILISLMILGRVEIIAFLIILSPVRER
ncbi:MAG: potassium transporter TrkG [archaeon]